MKLKKLPVILFLLSFNLGVVAQPAGNNVLTNAQVSKLKNCSRLVVSFSFPVRYLTHVPKNHGDTLRVQISPVAVGSTDQLAARSNESIRVLNNDSGIQIKEIIYEGEFSLNRPFLVVVFEKDAHFKVRSGKDFRSIVIDMASEAFDSCT